MNLGDIMKITIAELDFTQSTASLVRQQGIITCVKTKNKGWFWIEAGKFPTRQDLAVVKNVREVEI